MGESLSANLDRLAEHLLIAFEEGSNAAFRRGSAAYASYTPPIRCECNNRNEHVDNSTSNTNRLVATNQASGWLGYECGGRR